MRHVEWWVGVAKSAMRARVVRSCASLRHGSCVGDTLDHNPRGLRCRWSRQFYPEAHEPPHV
eukprot:6699947-Prymnesium_polylepis.1